MSYAKALPRGEVIVITETGSVVLTHDDGHRLLFHGSSIRVNCAAIERRQRLVVIKIGGGTFTVDAHTLARVFKGEAPACRIDPFVANAPGGGDRL